MIELYGVNTKQKIDFEKREYFLSLISESKRKIITNYLFREDCIRSLYGDLLIRYLICKRFNMENKEIIFSKNKFGRPYIKDLSFSFNISHSGDWVLCVIDKDNVAVDIEKIKEAKLDIAKRFFTKTEYDSLIQMDRKNQNNYFYILWTIKESYIKWLGTGMSNTLNSFNVSLTENKIKIENKFSSTKVPFLKVYDIFKDYKIAICSDHSVFPEKINFININTINIK